MKHTTPLGVLEQPCSCNIPVCIPWASEEVLPVVFENWARCDIINELEKVDNEVSLRHQLFLMSKEKMGFAER